MLKTKPRTDVSMEQVGRIADEALTRAKTTANLLQASLAKVDISIAPDDRETVKTTPYGFDVHRARRQYLEEQDFLDYLTQVGKDAASAVELCEHNDIPVIAVLPETVWSRVCVSAELFTLWPTLEGKVGVSSKAVQDYIREQRGKVKTEKSFFWERPHRRDYDEIELEREQASRSAIQHFFSGRPKKSLMLDLLPDYGTRRDRYDTKDTMAIHFPEPPAEYGLALLKLHKIKAKIGIVVEAEAIDISEFIQEWMEEADRLARIAEALIEANRQRRIAELKATFSLASPDPILTFPHGKVRVIVAQYGEWPLELQAIQTALQEDLRISFD